MTRDSPPPLHGSFAAGDAVDDPGRAHRRPAADRRSAEPDQSTPGLPVPHALRLRRSSLRTRRTGVDDACRLERPRRRLPHVRSSLGAQPRGCATPLSGRASAMTEPLAAVRDLTLSFPGPADPTTPLTALHREPPP